MVAGLLRVEVTAFNVKKIDQKAYGINRNNGYVVLQVGDKKERTETLPGLDGVWEKVFEFNVQDGDGDKMKGTFFMDEEQNGGLQIGDTQEFLLDKLVKGKQTYKAIIVPGGKVDLMVTAVDFGAEEKADEGDGLDFLDDADGGMMMDDDDEDED